MSKLKKTGNQLKNEMVEMNKSLTNGDVLVSNVLRPKSKDGKAGFVDINDLNNYLCAINPEYANIERSIVEYGDIIEESHHQGFYDSDISMKYMLTSDNLLIILGNGSLDADNWSSKYESIFTHLDFHTAIIMPGVKCLSTGCFRECKNLRKVILNNDLLDINFDFAYNSPIEYLEEKGLCYLGTANNPYFALMGFTERFDGNEDSVSNNTVIAASYGNDILGFLTDVKNGFIPVINQIDDFIYVHEYSKEKMPVNMFFSADLIHDNNIVKRIVINNKVGLKNRNGEWLAKPIYENAYFISEIEIVAVKQNGLWGFMKEGGEWLTTPQFEFFDKPVCNGMIRVKKDGKWMIIRSDGQFVTASIYDYIEPIPYYTTPDIDDRNRIIVRTDDRYGYIDTCGRSIIPPRFEDVERFGEMYAPAKWQGKWGYINSDGEWVIQPQYEAVDKFEHFIGEFPDVFYIALVKHNNKWGILNHMGSWYIEPQFEDRGSMNLVEPATRVKFNGKWGFYNFVKKDWFVKPIFEEADNYEWGYDYEDPEPFPIFPDVCLNGMWMILDLDGVYCNRLNLDIRKKAKRGFFDIESKICKAVSRELLEAKNLYSENSSIEYFNHNNKHGFIVFVEKSYCDKHCYIIKPIFDDIKDFFIDVTWARFGDKWGLINYRGEWIAKPYFDVPGEFSFNEKLLKFTSETVLDGHKGFIDREGNFI